MFNPDTREDQIAYVLTDERDSWGPAPGEEIVTAWRGPIAEKVAFLKAWSDGASEADAAAACHGMGAVITAKAQQDAQGGIGLAQHAQQWAAIAGAEDGLPPNRDNFWHVLVRSPPRCVIIITDGLGADNALVVDRLGSKVGSTITVADTAIAIGPQRAAAMVKVMRKLGEALVVAFQACIANAIPVSKELWAACVAAWRYGAPIAEAMIKELVEWVQIATEFLMGVDYVGIATQIYECLKTAAEIGIEAAKFVGPIALQILRDLAAQGVAVATQFIDIVASVDWEAEAGAAYSLAMQGAMLAAEHGRTVGKLIVAAAIVAGDVGEDVVEEARRLAEEGAPVIKDAADATALIAKDSAEATAEFIKIIHQVRRAYCTSV
jgi:hypothetical protein